MVSCRSPLSEPRRRSSCPSGWPARASHTDTPDIRLRSEPVAGWWCAQSWRENAGVYDIIISNRFLRSIRFWNFFFPPREAFSTVHFSTLPLEWDVQMMQVRFFRSYYLTNQQIKLCVTDRWLKWKSEPAHVGSLARFRNKQTLSMDPFSSKSDLKKRAVSMLTWKRFPFNYAT